MNYLSGLISSCSRSQKIGRNRNRTDDLFLAREARYQLRHVPMILFEIQINGLGLSLQISTCDNYRGIITMFRRFGKYSWWDCFTGKHV